jgi:hypothetical protein
MTYTTAPAKMHSGHDIRDARGSMVAIVHSPAADPAQGAKIAALMAAAPALLAAARLALAYLETLPYQPSIHPSTKAQDALHDAIVAAQGVPT